MLRALLASLLLVTGCRSRFLDEGVGRADCGVATTGPCPVCATTADCPGHSVCKAARCHCTLDADCPDATFCLDPSLTVEGPLRPLDRS